MSICTLYLRHEPDAPVPLLILSNREEFVARATEPLHLWADAPVLAGRDLKSGGTWLGINPKTARFAAVLNVREGGRTAPAHARTRGELVSGFLQSELAPLEWLAALNPSTYDGFNLIVGDLTQAYLFSNRGAQLIKAARQTEQDPNDSGFKDALKQMALSAAFAESSCYDVTQSSFAISNGVLGSGSGDAAHPDWFKTDWLSDQAERLDGAELLSAADSFLPEVFELLSFSDQAPKAQLPDTGVPKLLEHKLSSLFIEMPGYGTQTSSVLVVDSHSYLFAERSHRLGKDHVLEGLIGQNANGIQSIP